MIRRYRISGRVIRDSGSTTSERIQTSEPIGSNRFTAGYERALERASRIIDSWIPVVCDNKREMG